MALLNDPPPPDDKKSELEQKSLYGDHERGEGLKKHIYKIVCISMYIFLLFFIVMIAVWIFHITAPECWRWLSEIEVHMLERIVFGSGILLTFATKYFKKYEVI
jgi:hypothetical protein